MEYINKSMKASRCEFRALQNHRVSSCKSKGVRATAKDIRSIPNLHVSFAARARTCQNINLPRCYCEDYPIRFFENQRTSPVLLGYREEPLDPRYPASQVFKLTYPRRDVEIDELCFGTRFILHVRCEFFLTCLKDRCPLDEYVPTDGWVGF